MALQASANEPMVAPPAVVGRATRVVKRYRNRKLYDTAASRYVKLEDVADMIRIGVDVTVVEHPTGRDVTTVALAHIIFSEELRDPTRGSRTLEEVIRTAGAADCAPIHHAGAVARRDLAGSLGAAAGRVRQLAAEGDRMVASASEMARAAEDAVVRLQHVAAHRIDTAHAVVDGLARVKAELARIARRIDVLHESLRELDD